MALNPSDNPPLIHPDNVVGSPATTALGIGYAAQTIGGYIIANGLPATAGGWFGMALNALVGLAGVFGRR